MPHRSSHYFGLTRRRYFDLTERRLHDLNHKIRYNPKLIHDLQILKNNKNYPYE